MSKPAPKPASRTEVESVLCCGAPRPVPLFLPAIYEHKAWFIGSTPSALSRDAGLLERAMLAEFEAVGADALTVGVDVYNVEAEAVGCKVTFHEGSDTSIPGIRPGSHVLRVGDDVSRARLPDPLKDGRMPVNIEAARRVRAAVGPGVWLRGAISGPFSLAISLVGAEALFMACLDTPEWVHAVLGYASRIIQGYAGAYIDAGAELVVFDSQASPDLISPPMYEEFVLPATARLAAWARSRGVLHLPLVIGGNTAAIADLQVRTGCNNLLCDFTADFDAWSGACRAGGVALRRNLSPRLIEASPPEQVYEAARLEVAKGRGMPGFIMGTAVIPFGTPTESILAVKQACLDASGR
jgi:uroporphyrinogen decarboxylase